MPKSATMERSRKDHGLDFVYNQLAESIRNQPKNRQKRRKTYYPRTRNLRSDRKTEKFGGNVVGLRIRLHLIVLTSDRETLYRRINARVCKMFESGLINEVKRLTQYENCQSMQAIGYKQTIAYLKAVNEKQSLAALVDEVCKLSRNYAKRQMTFFRGIRSPRKCYIDAKREDLIFNLIQEFLNKKDN
ncbi:MAG: hypothetical protein ACLUSP_01160 [Christensenellales bacterium]